MARQLQGLYSCGSAGNILKTGLTLTNSRELLPYHLSFFAGGVQEARFDDAVRIRRSSLDFAKLSGDESLQWIALHSLGLTLKENG